MNRTRSRVPKRACPGVALVGTILSAMCSLMFGWTVRSTRGQLPSDDNLEPWLGLRSTLNGVISSITSLHPTSMLTAASMCRSQRKAIGLVPKIQDTDQALYICTKSLLACLAHHLLDASTTHRRQLEPGWISGKAPKPGDHLVCGVPSAQRVVPWARGSICFNHHLRWHYMTLRALLYDPSTASCSEIETYLLTSVACWGGPSSISSIPPTQLQHVMVLNISNEF